MLFIALAVASSSVQAQVQAGARAGSSELSPSEAERLVRAVHFEGLPEAEAARIGAAGAARLAAMLADPAERAHHGTILLALGICGQPGALEAIEAWTAAAPVAGEIDRGRFRAQQILPFALARLARQDARAVEALARNLDQPPPGWSFRQFRGERLRRERQRALVTALGESGRPEAARVLDRVGARAGLDPELAAHARAVRAGMAAATTRPTAEPQE